MSSNQLPMITSGSVFTAGYRKFLTNPSLSKTTIEQKENSFLTISGIISLMLVGIFSYLIYAFYFYDEEIKKGESQGGKARDENNKQIVLAGLSLSAIALFFFFINMVLSFVAVEKNKRGGFKNSSATASNQ